MKYYEVFWRTHNETYCKSFRGTDKDYMNQFVRELQERLNVEYIEVVTHETIPCGVNDSFT